MTMKTVTLAIAALVAGSALAQSPPGKKFYENIKPGLYKQTAVHEMKGMGVPKEQEKGTETIERCVTKAEVDKGLEMRGDCTVKKEEVTASAIHMVAQCKDGSMNEVRMAQMPGGYNMEMKSAGKGPDGKPFSMNMKLEAKYIGPCK